MSLLLPLLRYVPPLYIHVYNYQWLFIDSYHRLDLTEKEFTVGADTFAAIFPPKSRLIKSPSGVHPTGDQRRSEGRLGPSTPRLQTLPTKVTQ